MVVKAVGGSSESSTSLDIVKSVRNVVSTSFLFPSFMHSMDDKFYLNLMCI